MRRLLAAAGAGGDFRMQLACARRAAVAGAWLECAGALACPGRRTTCCVLHDVTAGRRARIAARAKAEQFRLLADNVPVLIAYYEAERPAVPVRQQGSTRAPSAATSSRSSA